MRLIKYTSILSSITIFIAVILIEIGFKDIGTKLFLGGGLALAAVIGLFFIFSSLLAPVRYWDDY